jgi:hypothetical protein
MKNKLDLSKAPLRGIYSEIAREQSVSPQAIRQAVLILKNPRIIKLLQKKIKERLATADYVESTISRN